MWPFTWTNLDCLCCLQVSEDTYHLLGDLQQDFELREAVSVKGKGVMQTYVLREEVAVQVEAESAAELCTAQM
jgi:hypothetical protein